MIEQSFDTSSNVSFCEKTYKLLNIILMCNCINILLVALRLTISIVIIALWISRSLVVIIIHILTCIDNQIGWIVGELYDQIRKINRKLNN